MKKQDAGIQYSLFDATEAIEPEENRSFYPSSKTTDECCIPDYDTFCLITFKDMEPSGLIDKRIIYAMASNKKEKLIDLLHMTRHAIYQLRGVGKERAERMIQLKKDLSENSHTYTEYYKLYHCKQILPMLSEAAEVSGFALIRLFFKQYVDFLLQTNQEKTAKILSDFLGINRQPLTLKMIGNELSVSSERVRQLLATVTNELNLLFNGQSSGNLRLADNLLQEVRKLTTDYLYSDAEPLLNDIFRDLEEEDAKVLFTHYLYCFDLDLFVINKKNIRRPHSVYIIIPLKEKILYYNNLSLILYILRDSPFWFTSEDIENKSAEHPKKEQLYPHITQAILHKHPWIERDNAGRYRLAWCFLGSATMEIRRILLDQARPMTRMEVLEEYNRLAIEAEMETITSKQLIFRADSQFRTQDKAGIWYYDPNSRQKESVRTFMEAYMLEQGGKIHFEQLKSVIDSAGYIYSDATIRAYLLSFCRVGVKDPTIFIHPNYIDKFPNIRLRKKSTRENKNERTPSYYNQVTTHAIAYLQQQPQQQCPIYEVYRLCKPLLPEGTATTVIYKILNNCPQLTKFNQEQTGKVWIRFCESSDLTI